MSPPPIELSPRGDPMPQVIHRRPWPGRWALALLLAAIAVTIGTGGAMLALHRRRAAGDPAWSDIQRLVSVGRWAEAKPRLERWVAAHPQHGESRVLLSNVELGLRRRDAALKLLRSIPEADASWPRAQMVLGTLAVGERRAADAERIFRLVAERDPRAIEP